MHVSRPYTCDTDGTVSVLLDATFNYDKRLKWDTSTDRKRSVVVAHAPPSSLTATATGRVRFAQLGGRAPHRRHQ